MTENNVNEDVLVEEVVEEYDEQGKKITAKDVGIAAAVIGGTIVVWEGIKAGGRWIGKKTKPARDKASAKVKGLFTKEPKAETAEVANTDSNVESK